MLKILLSVKCRKNGELLDFNHTERKTSNGHFVLFIVEDDLVLVIEEGVNWGGHQSLVWSLPQTFNYEYTLGGGSYMHLPKVLSGDTAWMITWYSGTYGDIPKDEHLRTEIAQVITGGDEDVNLG